MDNNVNYDAHVHKDDNYGYVLSEKDFYPPEDTRVLRSGVNDIVGGDNFADYSESFFDMCDEEEYYDDCI